MSCLFTTQADQRLEQQAQAVVLQRLIKTVFEAEIFRFNLGRFFRNEQGRSIAVLMTFLVTHGICCAVSVLQYVFRASTAFINQGYTNAGSHRDGSITNIDQSVFNGLAQGLRSFQCLVGIHTHQDTGKNIFTDA